MRRTVEVVSLLESGPLSFDSTLVLHRDAASRAKDGGAETLFLLEHADVITLGRNADARDLHVSEDFLASRNIALRVADRGGKLTYHGPGQLVVYPILNLSPDRTDVRRYVRDLEEVLIRTLADFGIAAGRSCLPERVTSVWIGNDKIAAIGVHISRWITTHGFALNVTDQPLENFRGIVPCGIRSGGLTTMERALGQAPALAQVAARLLPRFAGVFEREIMAAS